MAVRKKATKISQRAKSNLDLDVEISSKTKRSAKKAVKSAGVKALLLAFVFLILGLGVGAGAWWIVCRNDCFELIGQEEVTRTEGDVYKDDGVKIIAFGKDDSFNIEIETNLKVDADGNYYADEVGTYYIKYISLNFKYNTLFKVEKVRLVTFVEASEGGV